jgi:hypothetical protein
MRKEDEGLGRSENSTNDRVDRNCGSGRGSVHV